MNAKPVQTIPDIGPITATALGDARQFKRGREVSAFLGLTPPRCLDEGLPPILEKDVRAAITGEPVTPAPGAQPKPKTEAPAPTEAAEMTWLREALKKGAPWFKRQVELASAERRATLVRLLEENADELSVDHGERRIEGYTRIAREVQHARGERLMEPKPERTTPEAVAATEEAAAQTHAAEAEVATWGEMLEEELDLYAPVSRHLRQLVRAVKRAVQALYRSIRDRKWAGKDMAQQLRKAWNALKKAGGDLLTLGSVYAGRLADAWTNWRARHAALDARLKQMSERIADLRRRVGTTSTRDAVNRAIREYNRLVGHLRSLRATRGAARLSERAPTEGETLTPAEWKAFEQELAAELPAFLNTAIDLEITRHDALIASPANTVPQATLVMYRSLYAAQRAQYVALAPQIAKALADRGQALDVALAPPARAAAIAATTARADEYRTLFADAHATSLALVRGPDPAMQNSAIGRYARGLVAALLRSAGVTAPVDVVGFEAPSGGFVEGFAVLRPASELTGTLPPVTFGVNLQYMLNPQIDDAAVYWLARHEIAHVADNILGARLGGKGINVGGTPVPMYSIGDPTTMAPGGLLEEAEAVHAAGGPTGSPANRLSYPFGVQQLGPGIDRNEFNVTELIAQHQAFHIYSDYAAAVPVGIAYVQKLMDLAEQETGWRFSDRSKKHGADKVATAPTSAAAGFRPNMAADPLDYLWGPGSANRNELGAIPGTSQSTRSSPRAGPPLSTADSIRAELPRNWARDLERSGRLTIFETAAEAIKALKLTGPIVARARNAQGMTLKGDVYLIAENLDPGMARSVLYHEGFHAMVGDLKTRSPERYAKLMGQLRQAYTDLRHSAWVQKALARVNPADMDNEAVVLEELAAYAIEEYSKKPSSLPQQFLRWVHDVVATVRVLVKNTLGIELGTFGPAEYAAMARGFWRKNVGFQRLMDILAYVSPPPDGPRGGPKERAKGAPKGGPKGGQPVAALSERAARGGALTPAEWKAFEQELAAELPKVIEKSTALEFAYQGYNRFGNAGRIKRAVAWGTAKLVGALTAKKLAGILVARGQQHDVALAPPAPAAAVAEVNARIAYLKSDMSDPRLIEAIDPAMQDSAIGRFTRGYVETLLRGAGVTVPMDVVLYAGAAGALGGNAILRQANALTGSPRATFMINMMVPIHPNATAEMTRNLARHELAHIADNILGARLGGKVIADKNMGGPMCSTAAGARMFGAGGIIEEARAAYAAARAANAGAALELAYPFTITRVGKDSTYTYEEWLATELLAQHHSRRDIPGYEAAVPLGVAYAREVMDLVEKETGFRFSDRRRTHGTAAENPAIVTMGVGMSFEEHLEAVTRISITSPDLLFTSPLGVLDAGEQTDSAADSGGATAVRRSVSAQPDAAESARSTPHAGPARQGQEGPAGGVTPAFSNRSGSAKAAAKKRRAKIEAQNRAAQNLPENETEVEAQARVTAELTRMLGKKKLAALSADKRLFILPAIRHLVANLPPKAIVVGEDAPGFVYDGAIYLAARNIPPGGAAAALLREGYSRLVQTGRDKAAPAYKRLMALLASIDTEQNKSKWFTEAAARIPEGVTGEARLEALGALALETWLARPGKLSVRMLAWVRHAIAWARTLLAEKFGIETGKIGPAEIAVMVRRSLTQPAAQDEAQSLDDAPYFSFAGARAANLPAEAQAALEKAKAAYEAQDIDARKGSEDSLEVADAVTEAEDIRAETGWFKWVDGQWRYEINDFVSGPAIARADPSESFGQVLREKYGTRMLTHLTVKDLLRHPTLFAVYPELKDIPVQVYDGIGAALVTARRKIDFIEIGTENPIGRLHSTLLHELQHAIQSLEGHAHGTSTEAEARRLGVATALRQARERVEALRQKDQSDPTRGVDLMHASNEYRALKDRVYNQYHRTAGEVEARNTQARKDMTEKQRRETPPAATQDVADEDTAPGDLRFSDRPVVLGDDMTTAFSLLAQFDDAFQLPTPTKTTVADIAKEINPQLHVRELTPSEYGSAGARKGWAIDTPVGTSRSARGLLYERDGRVWINVAGLTAGEHSGNQIYAIAAGYAHNTKKVFMGDPEGLSPTGFYRRLENMISSALRYGTTDHLAPHESQRQPERFHPGAEYSGLGIKWKPGDTVHNLTEMMRASYNAALRQLPGIKDFTYDFDRQSFVDLRTDASVTRDGMRKAIRNVSPGASQSYTGGSATTARAVLYGTILRGKGTSDGPSALAGPGRQLSRGSLDPELDHIFYSERADEAAAEPTYTPGAEEEEIRQWVAKALGPKVKVAFEDLAGGKNAEWSRKDTEAVMKIATSALSPLSVAHFEAMRELFARLTKANSPLATTLARNFSKPYIQKALREHLPKDVWDSLDDIPTRIAYGFQLWAGGKRLFESSTLPLFRRIKAFIQTLLGIVTDSERIEHIFHAFGSGKLATESAVAAALKSDPVLAGRYTLDAETLLKATWNGLNALLATAQNTLTDSKIKEFQQIGHLLSKPTGTATNAANPESYLDAKARRSNELYSAFYATFHKVTPEASDDAIKRWRGGAWKGNAIVEDMQRMMAKLYRYTNEAMGQSLDPNNPRFPRVWDPEAIRDNFAKFTKALQAAYEKATQKTLSVTDAEELARAMPVGVAKAGNPWNRRSKRKHPVRNAYRYIRPSRTVRLSVRNRSPFTHRFRRSRKRPSRHRPKTPQTNFPAHGWLADNAQAMLNLRSMRANQQWTSYWRGGISLCHSPPLKYNA